MGKTPNAVSSREGGMEGGREGREREGEWRESGTAKGGRTLTHQISSECVHCIGFRWPKSQFGANVDIRGLLYRL